MPFVFEGSLVPGGVADAKDDTAELGIHQSLEVDLKWRLRVADNEYKVRTPFMLTANREWKFTNYSVNPKLPGGFKERSVAIKFVKGKWLAYKVSTDRDVTVLKKNGTITNSAGDIRLEIGDDTYGGDIFHPSYEKIWGVSEDFLWIHQGQTGAFATGSLDIAVIGQAPPPFQIPKLPVCHEPVSQPTPIPNVSSLEKTLVELNTKLKYVSPRDQAILERVDQIMEEFQENEKQHDKANYSVRFEAAKAEVEKLLQHVDGFRHVSWDPQANKRDVTYKL